VLQHQILTDKKVGDWLRNALQEELNDVEQANLREMTRQYQQAALLPNHWWRPKHWRAASANMPGALSVRQMTGPGSARI
jgi:Zn-dependent M32 family carboxypeptidase